MLIPLGVGPPSQREPVVATGAAAGLVHPATGYSVAASSGWRRRWPPPSAPPSRRGRSSRGRGRRRAGRVACGRRRAARVLEQLGLRSPPRAWMPAETRAFFDAFFSLPPRRWGPYLSGTAGPVRWRPRWGRSSGRRRRRSAGGSSGADAPVPSGPPTGRSVVGRRPLRGPTAGHGRRAAEGECTSGERFRPRSGCSSAGQRRVGVSAGEGGPAVPVVGAAAALSRLAAEWRTARIQPATTHREKKHHWKT